MNYRYKDETYSGFTVTEVMAALVLLVFICTGSLVVISRCVKEAGESKLRMAAFEIARDNLEGLMSLVFVEQGIEYGVSEKYPQVRWQLSVENFTEPEKQKIWIQAVSTAEYEDSENQTQTIELVYWLTDISDQDAKKLREIEGAQNQMPMGIAEAARYAGVDEETIKEWIDNGLELTPDGISKDQLDQFKNNKGPTPDPLADMDLPENWDQMSNEEQVQWLFQKWKK